jgi:hypothetical protein
LPAAHLRARLLAPRSRELPHPPGMTISRQKAPGKWRRVTSARLLHWRQAIAKFANYVPEISA